MDLRALKQKVKKQDDEKKSKDRGNCKENRIA